jgi:DNA-binding CsgD family transcriptional regulator
VSGWCTDRELDVASCGERPPLVGRSGQLRALAAALTGAAQGKTHVMVVCGDPGIGKSALLEVAREQAARVGFTTVTTSGIEFEQDVAFGGLLAAFRPLLALLDQLPELPANALRGALGLGAPIGKTLSVYGAALSLVALAAEQGPVLLTVDDAQWLDRESMDALTFVAHRLRVDRVAIIFSVRDGGSLADGRRFPTMELAGLTPGDAADLLAPLGIEAAVAAECHARTGGNPLALLEAARHLSAGEADGSEPLPDHLPVGRRLQDAFTARLADLEPAARYVLELAALEGTGDLRVIAAALDRGRNRTVDVEAVLHEADSSGLLVLADGRISWSHPLARAAVHQATAADRRRSLHRDLAHALDEVGQSERAPWHFAQAALGPDEDVAHRLEASADAALVRGARVAAAQAFDAAAALSPRPVDRARRTLAAADAWWSAGEPGETVARLEPAIAAGPEPVLRARMAVILGQAESWLVGPARASARFETEAVAIGATEPALAAELWLHAAIAHLLRIEVDLARSCAAAGRRSALAAQDPAVIFGAEALASMLAVLTGDEPARPASAAMRDLLLAALQGGVAGSETLAVVGGFVDMVGEDFSAAIELMRQVVHMGEQWGMVGQCVFAVNVLADCLWRSGRWAEARAELDQADSLAVSAGLREIAPLNHAVLARVEAGMGREHACRCHAAEAERLGAARGLDLTRSWSAAAIGLLELGLGQMARAAAAFDTVSALAGHVRNPGWLWWQADAVESYAGAGRGDDAVANLERLEEQAGKAGGSWAAAVTARCGALVRDRDPEDGFATALDGFRSAGIPFEEARTLLLRGEHRLRRGHRRDGARDLVAARALFGRLGARPWAARAAHEETRTVSPSSLASNLTDAELRVALVVGEGASNREAASQLFLSIKTVDFHLQAIYRKLGIRSRSQLARLLPAA